MFLRPCDRRDVHKWPQVNILMMLSTTVLDRARGLGRSFMSAARGGHKSRVSRPTWR